MKKRSWLKRFFAKWLGVAFNEWNKEGNFLDGNVWITFFYCRKCRDFKEGKFVDPFSKKERVVCSDCRGDEYAKSLLRCATEAFRQKVPEDRGGDDLGGVTLSAFLRMMSGQ